MLSNKSGFIGLLILYLFLFQSCGDDNLDLDGEDLVEIRGGGNGIGGNGGGGNGGDGGPGGGDGKGGGGNGGGGNPNGPDMDELSSDVLTDWQEVFLEIDRYAFGMRPNATARAIAYINLAAYETANPYMRNYRSLQQRLDGLTIESSERPDDIDMELALNTCYADVLHHFMRNVSNGKKSEIDALEAANEEIFASDLTDDEIADSRAWGTYVAEQIIAYSQTDTEAEEQILSPQPTSYEPPTGDGYWTYSAEPERALFPYWGSTRTFMISSEATSSVPPLEYNPDTSSPYFGQMQEVYLENNTAKDEQNEQLWIAEFWSDDAEGIMMSPPGRQVSIAKQLVALEELDLEESLLLFLKLGFSLNDAAVSVWADKYEYMVMRPNVYIKEFIDESFQTNLFRIVYWPNPSFPGYPSGHSTFASAAAGVFIDNFGDNVQFTDETHAGRTEFLGEARTFQKLSDLAEENAFSRIPLGVHVRMDCVEGYRLGYEIADAVNKLDLRRNHHN